jgi:hypothetical protein
MLLAGRRQTRSAKQLSTARRERSRGIYRKTLVDVGGYELWLLTSDEGSLFELLSLLLVNGGRGG